ncbi:GIY-YIG nuclease family protein [Convivina praedatoris]|uniref:GIY-YIG domain-containing protein n=1 Tax=Convivina praedatoris TaxID=2880963 RepID=A0ABM9D0L7_9LACO|nr:GIY-YIG nuclease family protein [Convivina sp. LMG 32447]CAH1851826.1 hypothetical protein LMG032447_00416 [Convivina sp. LMG 32447]CAH1851853.1 hypothetical protein R078138_00426 [Convivina sp. LMG 32447]CAH1853026.1 hypothetical protein R077815_00691 [Convivina sp. LMG 32447]
MPRHIFINQESTNDHISIYYNEPIFIVSAQKDDLTKINLLEEAHKPGIYILIGEHKRYVGQASGATFTRLQQHSVHKNWWHKVIFFGREDGHLSKAQLDFLEAELIQEFSKADLELDNNTIGNTSYIDKLGKITAKTLLVRVKDTLANIANINLFDEEISDIIDSEDTDENFVDFNNKRYVNKFTSQIFIEIITDLVHSEKITSLMPFISDEEPNTIQFIGTASKISSLGKELTKPITDTPYYVYTNFTKINFKKRLERIAQELNQKIDIHF